jgi:hypothetical protein
MTSYNAYSARRIQERISSVERVVALLGQYVLTQPFIKLIINFIISKWPIYMLPFLCGRLPLLLWRFREENQANISTKIMYVNVKHSDEYNAV